MFYKLEDNIPVECGNVQEWAEWFENAGERRIVAQTNIGDILVSTVFLGIDHRATEASESPLLFETMIFDNGEHGSLRDLYTTWHLAEVGHRRAVLRIRNCAAAKAL